MSVIPIQAQASSRGARMLQTALGPEIAAWLEDASVIEVMLNPDGRLWIDGLRAGIADTGSGMSAADGERIIRLVAHHVGAEVHAKAPRVSAELPECGERFEGLLPPVVAAPSFAIRKPAVAVFTLADYVAAEIMSGWQADALADAVGAKKNILVAGGTSTGKTTLTNALLAEVAKTDDRVVLIEDTRELQCAAPNLVSLRTKDGVASLSDLVRSALRLQPDRIPIGEAQAVAPANADYQPTDPQIAFHLARFIEQIRSIPDDPVIVRQNWLRAYDFTTDRGSQALNDYARSNDPFAAIGREQVAVDVTSVIRASPRSFRVAWVERRYRDGALAETSRWSAIVTIAVQPPRNPDALRKNPLGLFVTSINWSKELV